MPMLVDTHAHLDFEAFQPDRAQVVRRAQEADIMALLNVGVDVASSQQSIRLAEEFPCIYASVGMHPHEASVISHQESIAQLDKMLAHPRVVALGEIGLDYYRNESSKEDQHALLSALMPLYLKYKKPLILHARDSYDDLFLWLEHLRAHSGEQTLRGVLHCFSGTEDDLRRALDLGLYISFTGNITYKKSDQLRHCASLVSDDRFLVETDAPFLAPQLHRGSRNEPAYIKAIAHCLADIRTVSLDDIARITTRNCCMLFGFPDYDQNAQCVYKIRSTLYINTTRACTNNCQFCVRFSDPVVKGHHLALDTDPTVDEVLGAVRQYVFDYDEVVFCGLGEPLLRLDFITAIAHELKKNKVRIRIDTNGHGNVIHGRNIIPELAGLIDALSVSVNAPNEEQYNHICKPERGAHMFHEVLDFVRKAQGVIPSVTMSYVAMPEIDAHAMKQLADSLGVPCRARAYNRVG